jgi:hypothetical protein
MSELNPPRQTPRFYTPPAPPTVVLKPVAPWIWIASALVIVALVASAFPLIKMFRAQSGLANPVVTQLHARMTAADNAAIYADADPSYQTDVGRQGSNDLFDFVRTKLGTPHYSTRIGTNISNDSKTGEVLTLEYATAFDNGSGTETIKLHKSNGVYKLLGYEVQSPLLKQEDIPVKLRVK